MKADGQAKRAMMDALQNNNTDVGKHPEDFLFSVLVHLMKKLVWLMPVSPRYAFASVGNSKLRMKLNDVILSRCGDYFTPHFQSKDKHMNPIEFKKISKEHFYNELYRYTRDHYRNLF